jgi:glutathione S-transferase
LTTARPRTSFRAVSTTSYELFYWPSIQGRGEFIRLLLEEAGAPYTDVAREPGGMKEMTKLLRGEGATLPPLAPPFLRHGPLVIAQTTNVLSYLGPRHGLAPADEPGRLSVNQIALTIADFVNEVHDTHHPVASGLYYEDQKPEAARRSRSFVSDRVPKFLGYLEKILVRNGGEWLIGGSISYADLSAFQVLSGLRYAFPNAAAHVEPSLPKLVALHDRVAARPRIAAYLASSRRLPFNQQGIFRHYPELDAAKGE